MIPSLSAVIPSRNGLKLLQRLLPVLLEERLEEIVVVDDNSEDGTGEIVRRSYPGVRLITRTGPPGFCHAVNLGMAEASSEMLLLLNNDVMPEGGCLSGMASMLDGSPGWVAVVVPRITRPDGTDDGSYQWGFRRGLAFTSPGAGHSYPSGACALWRKSAWISLKGLSSRYAPIYWEDADLGARLEGSCMSMKRFAGPGVFHDHGATMGISLESQVLRERNRFIFMDSWCATPAMRFSTLAWLPVHMLAAALKGNRAFGMGYHSYRRWKHGRR